MNDKPTQAKAPFPPIFYLVENRTPDILEYEICFSKEEAVVSASELLMTASIPGSINILKAKRKEAVPVKRGKVVFLYDEQDVDNYEFFLEEWIPLWAFSMNFDRVWHYLPERQKRHDFFGCIVDLMDKQIKFQSCSEENEWVILTYESPSEIPNFAKLNKIFKVRGINPFLETFDVYAVKMDYQDVLDRVRDEELAKEEYEDLKKQAKDQDRWSWMSYLLP